MIVHKLEYNVSNAVQSDLFVGAVEASDGKNRITIIKNIGCSVGVGDEELIAQ